MQADLIQIYLFKLEFITGNIKSFTASVLAMLAIPLIGLTQNCIISEDISIQSMSTTRLVLEVSGLQEDDLANGQSLCGVRIVFSHSRVENIRINLISPSGQMIALTGPARINSGSTPFINWNVLFNPCSEANDPDSGLPGQWNNSAPWAAFSNYSGTYDPFSGCLEDFNTGSANGSWVLEIENLGDQEGEFRFFELIFCDTEGLDCEECISFAGDYIFESPGGVVSLCEGDFLDESLLQLQVEPEIRMDQSFAYLVRQDNSILAVEPTAPGFESFPAGTYQICSMVYDNSDFPEILEIDLFDNLIQSIQQNQFCASLSQNCLTLRILEVENIIEIDTVFCRGDTIFFREREIFEDFDTIVSFAGFQASTCDSLIRFSARVQDVNAVINAPIDQIVCGESVFLDAFLSTSSILPIANYQWSSNNGSLVNNFGPVTEVQSAGEYQLKISSGLCLDSTEISIASVDSFEFEIAIREAPCFGDSSLVDFRFAPDETGFNINGPSVAVQLDQNSFYINDAGVYTVTAQFGTCLVEKQFVINHDAEEITANINSSIIDCNFSLSEISITTNALDPSFRVEGPEILETDSTDFTLGSPGTYALEIISSDGCTEVQVFDVISDFEEPELEVSDLEILCSDPVMAMEFQSSSIIDSVIWSGPGNFVSNQPNPLPEESGTYFISVYGINGCVSMDSILYNIVNQEPQVMITGEDIDCLNENPEICIDSVSALDSIAWNLNGVLISSESCFQAFEAGTYSAFIRSDRCFGEYEYEISDLREELLFDLNLSDSSFSCLIDTVLARVDIPGSSDNIMIQWTGPGNFQDEGIEVTLLEEGQYSLELTDTISQCSSLIDFELSEIPSSLAGININVLDANCFPERPGINITGLPVNISFGIFINGDAIALQSLPNIFLDPGTYDIEILDENSCFFMTSRSIPEPRILELDLGADIVTYPGDQVYLEAQSNIDISEIEQSNWESLFEITCQTCLETEYQALENELIKLEIVDSFGCTAEDSLLITITEDKLYFIPNIFSPNGDGNNDDFEIYLTDAIIKVFEFRIFDRWGNLLLFRPEISGDNSNFVWDGFIDGQKAQPGVYIYVAKLLLADGTERRSYGEVSLLR